MDRLSPGVIAVGSAGVVVLALFVPWVARCYRRFGTVASRAAVADLGLVVSLFGIAAYTLMPLPTPHELTCQNVPEPQLLPFAMVPDILRSGKALADLLFNIALFIPLGMSIALRSVGRRRALRTGVAVSFLVALLVETTQLTGVWGVYPCAFRIFDVDDLITNTLGGCLGALASSAVGWSGDGHGRVPPDMPRTVTTGRALLGAVCDAWVMVVGTWSGALVVAAAVALTQSSFSDQRVATFAGVPFVLPLLAQAISFGMDGRSLGDRVVRIRRTGPPSLPAEIGRFVVTTCGWQLLFVTSASGSESALLGAVLLSAMILPATAGRVVDARAIAERSASSHGRDRRPLLLIPAFALATTTALLSTSAAMDVGGTTGAYRAEWDSARPARELAHAFRDALADTPGAPINAFTVNQSVLEAIMRADVFGTR